MGYRTSESLPFRNSWHSLHNYESTSHSINMYILLLAAFAYLVWSVCHPCMCACMTKSRQYQRNIFKNKLVCISLDVFDLGVRVSNGSAFLLAFLIGGMCHCIDPLISRSSNPDMAWFGGGCCWYALCTAMNFFNGNQVNVSIVTCWCGQSSLCCGVALVNRLRKFPLWCASASLVSCCCHSAISFIIKWVAM